MDIPEYSYEEMDEFNEERKKLVSAHTDKRYFTKIPVLPQEIDERKTKMYLACTIQRLPTKAG